MKKVNYLFLRMLTIALMITGLIQTACAEDVDGVNNLTDADVRSELSLSTDFESGSIGDVVVISNTEWEFYLADDNGDTSLPDEYRTWRHMLVDNVPTDTPVRFTIKNRGWPFYYVPVYSYDRRTWFRFDEGEVTQNDANEIVVDTRFKSAQVWLARFYPYTFWDLQNFIVKVDQSNFVEVDIPGRSQNGLPLFLLKITNPYAPTEGKKRVFIHARTHPAETPGSYVVEGLVEALLRNTPEMTILLSEHEFYIFPTLTATPTITLPQ